MQFQLICCKPRHLTLLLSQRPLPFRPHTPSTLRAGGELYHIRYVITSRSHRVTLSGCIVSLHCIGLDWTASYHRIGLDRIGLHHIIGLDCNGLHRIGFDRIGLHCIGLHHFIGLHMIALDCIGLDWIGLHCTILHCTTLYFNALLCIKSYDICWHCNASSSN